MDAAEGTLCAAEAARKRRDRRFFSRQGGGDLLFLSCLPAEAVSHLRRLVLVATNLLTLQGLMEGSG